MTLGKGNILVNDEGEAILCDFRLSKIRHDTTRTQTTFREGGLSRYLAPELSAGLDLTTRIERTSDIYSMGMTFFALASHSVPFSGLLDHRAISDAQEGKRPSPLSSSIDLSSECVDELWTLMGRMWDHTPSRRPNASDVADGVRHIAHRVRVLPQGSRAAQ